MQHNLHANFVAAAQQTRAGGLAIHTGLRGGVCIDVNDQVKSALQTLTNALADITAASTPAPTSVPATTSS